MSKTATAKLKLMTSMVIFGTIGVFVRYIPLPSSMLALARGLIGMLFLLLVVVLSGKHLSRIAVKANLLILILSGIALGINWMLLFEAYSHTTVATATLCYYLAPIFVILVAPVLLKERPTIKKIICVLVALGGMVLVSGVIETGIANLAELQGIVFGIGAAVLYASVILLNKRLVGISAYDKTIVQLGVSALVMLPYVLVTGNMNTLSLTGMQWALVAVVGILHTGVAYALYFGSMKELKAQTVAIFSYMDPVVAILLSVLLLKEEFRISGMIGAVMILGATLFSELSSET